MKFKPGRGRPGASMRAMNSMLSRDARRDVIKMAVVIGGGHIEGSGGAHGSSNTGRRRSSVASGHSLGKLLFRLAGAGYALTLVCLFVCSICAVLELGLLRTWAQLTKYLTIYRKTVVILS